MDVIKSFKPLKDLDRDVITKINFFHVFNQNVIIVMKNDSVFGFGDNIEGRLGFGHKNPVKELTQMNDLSNKQLIDMCFGKYHVLGLTKSGECISWGLNFGGELGYESNETLINKPKVIEYFTENNLIITSISCGSCHSMVLTDNGLVYTFGDNNYKEFDFEERTGFSQILEIESTITAISCGGYHCLALNNSGQVFIWGNNMWRQCFADRRPKRRQKRPEYCLPFIVEIGSKVCQISCGLTISLVLTEDKQIYSIGCIECFEINGFLDCPHDSDIIQKPFGEIEFTEIASHSTHNLFIVKSIDGYCYVWGHTVNGFVKYPQKTDNQRLTISYGLLCETNITYKSVVLPKYFTDILPQKLLKNVGKLFNDPKDSDFVFKFNDKQIFVHKFILKLQCNHFKTMFNEKWDNLDTNELEMKDTSYSAYYSFIKYLYMNVIEVENEDIYDLYDMSNRYFEEELKTICLKLIKDNITIENVLTVYSFSQKYELQDLELDCLEFCSNKWNQLFISNDFKQNDSNVKLNFIEKAAHLKLF